MATPPRLARPGTYLLTRRCLERRYFLKPHAITNELLTYLVGVGCERYDLELHAFCFLSNHYHLLVTDDDGKRISRFVQWFNSEVGRSMNCHLGRADHFWDNENSSQVWIPALAEDLVEKLAYTVCNPVSSLLVRSVKRWPGAVTRPGDVGKKTFTATRPSFFFDPEGTSPPSVTFRTTLPCALDATEEDLERRFRQRANEVQEEVRSNADAQGLSFVGVKKILATSHNDSPRSRDLWFGLSPHVACRDVALRTHLLVMLKRFRGEYRTAWLAFSEGARETVFPAGTLLMVTRFGCAHRDVAELDLFGGAEP